MIEALPDVISVIPLLSESIAASGTTALIVTSVRNSSPVMQVPFSDVIRRLTLS